MKIVSKTVQTLRDIANSRGGQDLSGWIGHGASELANSLVHGHVAPMYGNGTSSPEQEEFDKHNQDAANRDANHVSAKLEQASQGMKSRMEAPQQSQTQERSR